MRLNNKNPDISKVFLLGIIFFSLILWEISAKFLEKQGDIDENLVEILSPINGKILPAGYVDIKYKIDDSISSKIKKINIYINNELIEETKDLSYLYFTTEVKYHNLKIDFKFENDQSIVKTVKFGITKKGIGVNEEMGKNLNLSDLKVGWYFNWYNKPSTGDQYKDIEFVPMIWGEKNKNSAEEKINELIKQNYKYVFLFNEPDRADQSNMEVDEVFNIYRSSFQDKKIQISAPMTSVWPEACDWFKDFIIKIEDNIVYDFIVLHVYPDNFSGKAMAEWFVKDIIDKTYLTYKKPIWINEFSTVGSSVTEENTIEFYKTFIPLVNERSYVVRFSPFGFKDKPYSLWNYLTGKLTNVGKAFAEIGNPE